MNSNEAYGRCLDKIKELEQQLEKANNTINHLLSEVSKLDDVCLESEIRLKEAEKVIEFYSDHTNVDYNTKTAREYLTKFRSER